MTQHGKEVAIPFVATLTMGSPMVLSRYGLPRMESLLRHRQLVTGGGVTDALPLALHHCGIPAAGGLFAVSRQAPYNAESVTKGESIFQSLANLGFSGEEAERTVKRGHPRMKTNQCHGKPSPRRLPRTVHGDTIHQQIGVLGQCRYPVINGGVSAMQCDSQFGGDAI